MIAESAHMRMLNFCLTRGVVKYRISFRNVERIRC